MGFDARVDIGKGADRAGNGAGGDFRAGRRQTGAIAGEFSVIARELQAEGDRLGVNAMAAPDGRRHLMLARAFLQRRQQGVEIGQQDIAGLCQLNRQTGV